MTREEELALVNRAQNGDKRAFERLVEENQDLVYSLAYKIVKHNEDALDISQDALIKAYKNLSSFRGESRFSVWLYRLTYNAAIDHIKKNRRDTVSLTPEEGEQIAVPDPAPGPDEIVETNDTRRAVYQAILSLDEDKREILMMREYGGMDYSSIAAELGINEGTVKSRLSRARQILAEKLMRNGTFSTELLSKIKKGGSGNV